jgi:hypothetical protein
MLASSGLATPPCGVPCLLFLPLTIRRFPSPTAHTPRAAVERILKGGGICVKTFFERGFGRDRNLQVPSADLMKEIVAAAGAAHVRRRS